MSKKNKEKDAKAEKSKQAKIVKLNQDTEKNPLTNLFMDLQKLNEEIESHLKEDDDDESEEEVPIIYLFSKLNKVYKWLRCRSLTLNREYFKRSQNLSA